MKHVKRSEVTASWCVVLGFTDASLVALNRREVREAIAHVRSCDTAGTGSPYGFGHEIQAL